MFNSNKPLFSRPVLAVIIFASTLAIWLLNLTAPSADLPKPQLETWQTESGIPVYWVTQDDWSGSDKLSLSFVFQANTRQPDLVATTLGMLMGPSLPLSTATINQRLVSVAASVDSFHDYQKQVLNISLSSQPQYIAPALRILNTWLNQAHFKQTPLSTWQRQQASDLAETQLQHQLLTLKDQPFSDAPPPALSVADLTQYLTQMRHHVSHIMISGSMNDEAQKAMANGLTILTSQLKPARQTQSWQLSDAPSTSSVGSGDLTAIYGAVGLTSLTSVEDWLTLQIWARDMLQAQKDQLGSQIAQWQLHFGSQLSYANWKLQIPTDLQQDASVSTLPLSSWSAPSSLSSYNDSDRFSALKATLVQQLETLTRNPSWWADIGTRITHPDSDLTLESFIEHYSDAANSFTMEQYQQRVDTLVISSSRQEVQVRP